MLVKSIHISRLGLFKKNPSGVVRVKSVDSGKLNFLESVRGLAALAVLFTHVIVTYFPNSRGLQFGAPGGSELISRLFYGLPLGFMVSGNFAVVVFFVLSGFVLTYKFFQSGNPKDLHKQAAKRFLRLAIPIFFAVVISYIFISSGATSSIVKVMAMQGLPETARTVLNFSPTMTDAIYNATIGVILNKNAQYNPVLWTMSIEFFGSYIVLGLAAFMLSVKKRWIFYIGALIFLSNTYYACFILGMLLADIVNNTKFVEFVRDNVSKVYIYGTLVIVWVLACFPRPTVDIAGTMYKNLLFPGFGPFYIFNLWQFSAAFMLMAIILVRPEIQKLLSFRPLVVLGGLSFSLYLTHYLILHTIGDWLYVNIRPTYGISIAVIGAVFSTIIISIAVSFVWKKYIDDMSVSVSRQFAKYILK